MCNLVDWGAFYDALARVGRRGVSRLPLDQPLVEHRQGDRDGWKLVGRLDLTRIGSFRLHVHRRLEGEMRSLMINRQGRKWFAYVTLEFANGAMHRGPAADLDLGLTRFATRSPERSFPTSGKASTVPALLRPPAARLPGPCTGNVMIGSEKTCAARD